MSIRTRVTHNDQSQAVVKKYNTIIKRIVKKGAQDVRNTAVTNIQAHGSAGETYQKYNPRRTHTASAEGAYPNSDTGYLASNIFAIVDEDGLGSSVESRAEYSEYLEFGTVNMEARPFLQPSLEENAHKIIRAFARLKSRGV